jgi:hypothetical protein
MTYFLVKGRVSKTYYMGEETSFDDTRLVIADTPKEAEAKFEKYWSDQTSEYSVYYHAFGHALETIE